MSVVMNVFKTYLTKKTSPTLTKRKLETITGCVLSKAVIKIGLRSLSMDFLSCRTCGGVAQCRQLICKGISRGLRTL